MNDNNRQLYILRRGRHEKEIFSILSSARALTNIILAGKSGSNRHSITSFSENVVVTKTGYQMLGILSLAIGRGL